MATCKRKVGNPFAAEAPELRTYGFSACRTGADGDLAHERCGGAPPAVARYCGNQSRLRSFESRRRISRYNQISVTINPNAAYHSIYFGAPAATPLSMKSKSSTRFSAAMTTTNPLKAIPIGPEPLIVVK